MELPIHHMSFVDASSVALEMDEAQIAIVVFTGETEALEEDMDFRMKTRSRLPPSGGSKKSWNAAGGAALMLGLASVVIFVGWQKRSRDKQQLFQERGGNKDQMDQVDDFSTISGLTQSGSLTTNGIGTIPHNVKRASFPPSAHSAIPDGLSARIISSSRADTSQGEGLHTNNLDTVNADQDSRVTITPVADQADLHSQPIEGTLDSASTTNHASLKSATDDNTFKATELKEQNGETTNDVLTTNAKNEEENTITTETKTGTSLADEGQNENIPTSLTVVSPSSRVSASQTENDSEATATPATATPATSEIYADSDNYLDETMDPSESPRQSGHELMNPPPSDSPQSGFRAKLNLNIPLPNLPLFRHPRFTKWSLPSVQSDNPDIRFLLENPKKGSKLLASKTDNGWTFWRLEKNGTKKPLPGGPLMKTLEALKVVRQSDDIWNFLKECKKGNIVSIDKKRAKVIVSIDTKRAKVKAKNVGKIAMEVSDIMDESGVTLADVATFSKAVVTASKAVLGSGLRVIQRIRGGDD